MSRIDAERFITAMAYNRVGVERPVVLPIGVPVNAFDDAGMPVPAVAVVSDSTNPDVTFRRFRDDDDLSGVAAW